MERKRERNDIDDDPLESDNSQLKDPSDLGNFDLVNIPTHKLLKITEDAQCIIKDRQKLTDEFVSYAMKQDFIKVKELVDGPCMKSIVNMVSNKDGLTPFHMVILYMSRKPEEIALVQKLLDLGADVNLKDTVDGQSPLMLCVSTTNDTSSTLKLLIKNGANVNLQDKLGWNPLMMCAKFGGTTSSIETLDVLLDSGADVTLKAYNNEGNVGYNVLFAATYNMNTNSSFKMINRLLKIPKVNVHGVVNTASLNHLNFMQLFPHLLKPVFFDYNTEKQNDLLDLFETILLHDEINFAKHPDNIGISAYIRAIDCSRSNTGIFVKCNELKVLLAKTLKPTSDAAKALSRVVTPSTTDRFPPYNPRYSKSLAESEIQVGRTQQLPPEIWQIILENVEYSKLCAFIHNNDNIIKVKALALVFGIPLFNEIDGVSVSKPELCQRIAIALKSGTKRKWDAGTLENFNKVMNSTSQKYQSLIKEIQNLAYSVGISPDDPKLQEKLQSIINQTNFQ
jgi:hypothetical protein